MRNRYQVLILQMSRWWRRVERDPCDGYKIEVARTSVVNRIAQFADAVPLLPAIAHMPPPFGMRRAAKRAERRLQKAANMPLPDRSGRRSDAVRAVASGSAVVGSEHVPSFPAMRSEGELVKSPLQVVEHDQDDEAAVISEHEAAATARALWEAHVELAARSHAKTIQPADLAEAATDGVSSKFTAYGSIESDVQTVASPRASDFGLTVHLVEFSCSPLAMKERLHRGPELEPVREALRQAGRKVALPSGASIFVYPEHYDTALLALKGLELRPQHVVIADAFQPLLDEAIAQLPGRASVRPKSTAPLVTVKDCEDDEGCRRAYVVRRTFYCSASSGTEGDPEAQTSKERGRFSNPRRSSLEP